MLSKKDYDVLFADIGLSVLDDTPQVCYKMFTEVMDHADRVLEEDIGQTLRNKGFRLHDVSRNFHFRCLRCLLLRS